MVAVSGDKQNERVIRVESIREILGPFIPADTNSVLGLGDTVKQMA
jgi:hypothetical protein